MTTFEAVRQAVIEAVRVPHHMLDKVTEDKSLVDFGMDDIDILELIMDIEDHMEVDIPGELLEGLALTTTLGNLAEMIDKV